jgi:hypothetical protein
LLNYSLLLSDTGIKNWLSLRKPYFSGKEMHGLTILVDEFGEDGLEPETIY